jgi:hypothetical protein
MTAATRPRGAIVAEPVPKQALNAWECFREFEAAERHFNNLQNQYRTLASTWLLAAFGGIGFLIGQREPLIPIDTRLTVSGIGVAASLGLTLLWNLDLLVYHGLMFEYFQAGLELEEDHDWLPKVRTNIKGTWKGKLTQRVALFYIAGNSVMLSVAGLALASWSYRYGASWSLLTAALTLLVIVVIGWLMMRTTRTVTKTENGGPRRFFVQRPNA